MAETAIGAKSQLTWQAEATWGTAASSINQRLLPFVSETIKADIGIVENPEIRSDRRSATPGQGNLKPGGDINVVWTANSHGWMVYRALGGTVSTTGTGPFVHTIQEFSSSDLKSMTLEKGFLGIGQYFVYLGARINRISFSVSPESNVTGAIGIMAKNETASGTSLDATPFDQTHLPLNSFNGSVIQNAITLATMTEMTLNIDNTLAGINVIGSQFYGALLAARLKVTGTFSMFFENLTQYNIFRNFTETDFSLLMADQTTNYIQFVMENIRFGGSTPQISGEGPIFFSGDYSAYIDSVSGKQIVAGVKNALTNAVMIL